MRTCIRAHVPAVGSGASASRRGGACSTRSGAVAAGRPPWTRRWSSRRPAEPGPWEGPPGIHPCGKRASAEPGHARWQRPTRGPQPGDAQQGRPPRGPQPRRHQGQAWPRHASGRQGSWRPACHPASRKQQQPEQQHGGWQQAAGAWPHVGQGQGAGTAGVAARGG